MKKLREFDDMDWIRDTSSNLNGSAIVFEPMVGETAWPKIVNLIGDYHFGNSKILLVKDFNLFVDNIKLLHHLVIEEDGGVVFGGMYENAYYDLIDNGYSEEEIRNDWEEERDAMNNFFTRTFSKGFKPTIHDGYELFGLPRNINESDEMDWIRDVKPMITRSFGQLESEDFIELDGVDVVYIYGDVVYETFIDDGYDYANLNGEKFKIVEIKDDVGVIVLECLDNSLINDYKHLLFDIKDDGRAETIIGDYANDNKLVFKFVINNLNESDELDWIRDVKVSYLNKSFYFDPPAEQGDSDYEELVQLFKSEGFEPTYGTPDTPDTQMVGLYCYLDITDGTPSYVFTSADYDTESIEDYYTHIKDFAREESVDAGEDIEIVNARQFLSGGNYLNESDDMDWIRAVEPQIKAGAKFKSAASGIILTVTEIDGKLIIYDLFDTDGSVITKYGSLFFNSMQNDIDDGSWIPVP